MVLLKHLVAGSAFLLGLTLAQDTTESDPEVTQLAESPVSSEVSATPATTYAEEATTLAQLLPLPTEVVEPTKVNDTQNTQLFNGSFHALGISVPTSTATQTSAPVNFEELVTTDPNAGPPELSEGELGLTTNVTVEDPAAVPELPVLNVTATTETVTKRWGTIQKRARPKVVDWRTRWGFSWITTMQNQASCGSCWAFAATALMESMVRIQHGHWSKRSEGDLHDSYGVSCETGGWPSTAIQWAAAGGEGISDPVCFPYLALDNSYRPCEDRSGRAVRVPTGTDLYDVEEQKRWIDEVGPLTVIFEVYTDFDAWTPDKGVYRYDGVSGYRGLHAVLCVGYDDNQEAWIIKNSWGTGAGDNGYYLIGYGEVQIDKWPKTGLTNVDPDPWARRRHHSGSLIMSGEGETHRNFELVRNSGKADVPLLWLGRNGGKVGTSNNDYSWFAKQRLAAYDSSGNIVAGINVIGQPVITSTSHNRDLELVYWVEGGSLEHWYYSQNAKNWYYTGKYYGSFGGYPAYIQLHDGSFGLVARNQDGSLYEWNRQPNSEWLNFVAPIATGIKMSGPAYVQSNLGETTTTPGTSFVAAVRKDGKIQVFYKNPPSSWDTNATTTVEWKAGEVFGRGIGRTPPVMIQSFWGTQDEHDAGSLQLVVVRNGRVQHWQRRVKDLQAGGVMKEGEKGEWVHLFTFGKNIKHCWSLMHGAFNHRLELVVETRGGRLIHYQYAGGGWKPTAVIPNKI